MATNIPPPQLEALLGPLLASLPAAAVSPQPPTALLPLLSPILRQRVQLLSSATTDPWLPLLCYDPTKVAKLETVVRREVFEPHPVSGEVEVDWDGETSIEYKRIDEETLQALVSLQDLGLSIRLVWCVNDELGGGDGWRIGEVGTLDGLEMAWGGESTIAAAETTFKPTNQYLHAHATNGNSLHTPEQDEDDDDDYWNQYDKTPGHTPAPKDSPAPPTMRSTNNDDEYYAQYASVQPAMDNHDPDEAEQNGTVESSLGTDEITRELQSSISSSNPEPTPYSHGLDGELASPQPRPSSSAGSSGSETVERLEKRAELEDRRGQSEVGVKQHISTSVKSLYRLAKVAGIERKEFVRLVTTELDVLSLMDEDDD